MATSCSSPVSKEISKEQLIKGICVSSQVSRFQEGTISQNKLSISFIVTVTINYILETNLHMLQCKTNLNYILHCQQKY